MGRRSPLGLPAGDDPSDIEWAQHFRRRCTECNGTSLEWMSALMLGFRVESADRPKFTEILTEAGADSVAWQCKSCGSWGVFG